MTAFSGGMAFVLSVTPDSLCKLMMAPDVELKFFKGCGSVVPPWRLSSPRGMIHDAHDVALRPAPHVLCVLWHVSGEKQA